jgi:protein involved in ribonucleotide reduction
MPDVVLEMEQPFVLFFPTYGGGKVKGAIPKAVIDFIKNPNNQKKIIGIVGSGDRNYGSDYCLGAKILSEKLKVPLLYKYEIRGTNEDIYRIKEGILSIQKSINESK